MDLIIEDGTGVEDANSYATVQQCKDYCASRGFLLVDSDSVALTDEVISQLLVRACDYLQGLKFKGNKTDEANALEWPRENVFIGNNEAALESDTIPAKVIAAQCRLAYDSNTTDLQPTGDGREVVREKVDVIEVQYNPRGSGSVIPQPNAALSILTPYLEDGGVFSLRSVRV